MKRPMVAIRGRYFFPRSPMISTKILSKALMMSSRMLWSLEGTRLSLREARPKKRIRTAATIRLMTM